MWRKRRARLIGKQKASFKNCSSCCLSAFCSPEASFCSSLLLLTVSSAQAWFLVLQQVGLQMTLAPFLLSSLRQPHHDVSYWNSKLSPQGHHHECTLVADILGRQSFWLSSAGWHVPCGSGWLLGSREGITYFKSYQQSRYMRKSLASGKMWVCCTLKVPSFWLVGRSVVMRSLIRSQISTLLLIYTVILTNLSDPVSAYRKQRWCTIQGYSEDSTWKRSSSGSWWIPLKYEITLSFNLHISALVSSDLVNLLELLSNITQNYK